MQLVLETPLGQRCWYLSSNKNIIIRTSSMIGCNYFIQLENVDVGIISQAFCMIQGSIKLSHVTTLPWVVSSNII